MGTRADYYVGRGKDAEWLGSTAWDGYPSGVFEIHEIAAMLTEKDWRGFIANRVFPRDDFTAPAEGWPWPWNDSNTTDYAYAFDGDGVYGSCFGHPWWKLDGSDDFGEPEEDGEDEGDGRQEFPDMAARKHVQWGSEKGGIFVIGGNSNG